MLAQAPYPARAADVIGAIARSGQLGPALSRKDPIDDTIAGPAVNAALRVAKGLILLRVDAKDEHGLGRSHVATPDSTGT